jgi:sulfite exporter TauE/SafE
MEYISIFFISLAGSFHCVGMCGGIAGLQAGWGTSPAARRMHLSLYHLGKIGSYLMIGALFGAAGSLLADIERLLALLAGAFMIWLSLRGLPWFGQRVIPDRPHDFPIDKFFAALFHWIKGQSGFSASLSLGLLNGFLPCSLVYAFAARAAAAGSVAAGIGIMASFGLGTVPALLFSAQLIRAVSPALRRRFVSAGAFFIFVLGIVTLLRVFSPLSPPPGHG